MSDEFTSAWLESHLVSTRTVAADQIVGIGHVQSEVESVLARLRNPDLVDQAGASLPRGLLFYGPPGTGKTLIARYMVSALGPDVPLYEASADELSPERIRGTIRYLAEAHPRSVLYIDEIDTFALAREAYAHDTRTRQQLVAMLAALDGIVEATGPIVIASSNRPPRMLDQAITRPGRLGFHLRFVEPDEGERVALFELFAKNRAIDGAIEWAAAARATRGRSPAALRQTLDDALGRALASGRQAITAEDVEFAIARNGVVEPEHESDPAEDWMIAIHEAGHTAVGAALFGPAHIYAVKIGPIASATELGDESVWRRIVPASESARGVAVGLGGWAAERLIFGEASSGCEHDLTTATELTMKRVGSGSEPGFPLVSLGALGRLVSGTLRRRLNDTVEGRAAEAQRIASEIVEANRDGVERFARALLDAKTLSGDPLRAALADANFHAPDAIEGAA
jgi:cell division protease FtsH